MNHDVFCGQCGQTGSVGRVTASLACPGCGSDDIGLLGLDEFPAHLAKGKNPFADKDKDGHDTATKKEGPKGKRHDDDADDVKSETGSSGPEARQGGKPWEIDADKAKKRKKQGAAATGQPTRGSGGSGWGHAMPDPLKGWNDYAGPPVPGNNDPYQPGRDMSHNTTTCPVCRGTGYDVQDKTVCRECGGFGSITHPTQPEGPPATARRPGQTAVPQVGPVRSSRQVVISPEFAAHLAAGGNGVKRGRGRPSSDPFGSVEDHLQATSPDYRHRLLQQTVPAQFDPKDTSTYYPSADSMSPAVKTRQNRPGFQPEIHGDEPYKMNDAWCPMCGHDPTHLERDAKDDAWWSCPNCGPLANVDKNPSVNPYDTDDDFEPDRNMKRSSRFRRASKKTGRIFKIMAAAQRTNNLTDREAFELARRTVAAYPETV